ncbi:MAG: AzlD domain-containing protein [Lachnospiraceae bacterium]|nr:AzlD domain-containing protein [Lachnospiraceae bacterium]
MSIYIYILTMALTTYLLRMLPLTLFQKPIRSRFVRSFLYYVPYACLTAMTLPAIFSSTSSLLSAVIGFVVAMALALRGKGLVPVAVSACLAVFVAELLTRTML